MNKKICFFSGDISRSGGTERVATVIANELNNRGWEVCFLSLGNGKSSFFPLNKSIPLYSLEMENKSMKINYIKTVRKLHRFLKSNQIDFLVDIDTILTLFSVPATILLNTKVISWDHFSFDAKIGNFAQDTIRFFSRLISINFSFRTICLTKSDEKHYKSLLSLKKNVIQIYNPVTLNLKEESKRNKKRVLAVGHLNKIKGHDRLIKAWKLVKSKGYKDWNLDIIGGGDELENLLKLSKNLKIENSINFFGKQKNISDYYKNSSIFVLTSFSEGFPLVVLEARNFGLPVISFDCGSGIKEIIINKKDGIIVKQNDIKELAIQIIKLIENKTYRDFLGKNAFADKRFELKNIILQWEKIFE